MTLTECRPHDLIRIKLDFVKPFEASNIAEFTFDGTDERTPENESFHRDQTLVTWTMSGRKNFLCKAIGLIMNMDKMVGEDFEKGLAQMKSVVEAKK